MSPEESVIETGSRLEVTRGWGRGMGSLCSMKTELQFGKLGKVLEMDSGDGHTTVKMYLILLICTT